MDSYDRSTELISIHAPRAGGDDYWETPQSLFDISIHAPRAGGDGREGGHGLLFAISIHAPRAGGDLPGPCKCVEF